MMGVPTGTPIMAQLGNNFNRGSENCCGFIGSGSTPQFAYGCYIGSGVADRTIPTGINNPGVTIVAQKALSSTNTTVWRIPEMGANTSCGITNGDSDTVAVGTQQCSTNSIKTYSPTGGFTVGTSGTVNGAGNTYCWYQWSLNAGYHGTFTYTGNNSSPRTITLTGENAFSTGDAAVLVQNGASGGTLSPNLLQVRTDDMAANTSSTWAEFTAIADVTQGIRNFAATGFEVGTDLNTSAVVYYGAWFKFPSSSVGGTVTWTGTGNALGSNCASLADTANVSTGCSPKGVFTVMGLRSSTCTLSGGSRDCDFIRALNISTTADPGVITGDEYYGQDNAMPDCPNGVGNFGVNQFGVSGSPTSECGSCNDNGQSYWAPYWCLSAATIGSTAPIDWRVDSRLLALWRMEEASDTTRVNYNSTFGCPGSDCNLTNVGTVTQNTTNFKEGLAAAESSDSGDRLICALGTCNELKDNAPTAISWGGWLRTGGAGAVELIESESAQSQYRAIRNGGTSQARCTVRDSTFADISASTGAWGSNTFGHIACTWTNSGTNTVGVFFDGIGPTTATTANEMLAIGVGNFTVNDSAATVNTQVDEVFVYNGVLTATDVCRIHACGWGGEQCACFAGDPTVYIDTGRWAGSCTLPACNKLAPS